MGDPGGLHGDVAPSLTRTLNRDALEEVFLHCDPSDLLAMRATCKLAARLLDDSEKVWLTKLRESYRLHLKAVTPSAYGVFLRLARHVFEASPAQQLRFQGVFVNGGVDEDAMHYFVDNLFRNSKAPYCSNCSRDADCIAVLLDGEVPRDAEYARVRQYLVRRCRYAAALILNVQMPDQGRDPDDIMHILEDWTDMQLEGFFKDLVGAMQAQHALGRLLLYDISHDRLEAEEDKILKVHQWLLERPKQMLGGMLKPPGDRNTMLDTSAMPKLAGQEAAARLAAVVHEVSLSRMGSLTCPVSAGAVVLGSIDCSKIVGWSSEDVLALLQSAAADPAAAVFNGMQDADAVEAAAAAGLLPPILATDESLAGVWHEFDTSPEAAQRQAAAAEAAAQRAAAGSQQQQQQQQQQGVGQVSVAAATGSSSGPASCQPGARVSHQGIITWRPLLWFKFHSAEEAIAFVRRHRHLVEQRGTAATVRHRGPPPTRYGHVAAAATGGQQADQLQQSQAGALQPAQQQQAVAVGVPVPAGFAAPMPGVVPGNEEAMLGVPAAEDAQGAAVPPALPHLVPLADEDESSDGGEDDGSGGSSDEGSDLEEAAAGEGGWLHPWVHNEFGADLQDQEPLPPQMIMGEEIGFDEMEEGSSSEEEEGEGDHFLPQPAAGPGGQAGGAAPAQPLVQTSAAQTLLAALTEHSTRARNRLRVTLSRPVGGNLLLVKLINQENMMDQYGDPHSFPNIDMTHVGLSGKQVELPAGVTVAP